LVYRLAETEIGDFRRRVDQAKTELAGFDRARRRAESRPGVIDGRSWEAMILARPRRWVPALHRSMVIGPLIGLDKLKQPRVLRNEMERKALYVGPKEAVDRMTPGYVDACSGP